MFVFMYVRVTESLSVRVVSVHGCVFHVPVDCVDSWLSLSPTAAGKTSVSPSSVGWQKGQLNDKPLMSGGSKDTSRPLLSSLSVCAHRMEGFFEENWDLWHNFLCLKQVSWTFF